MKVSIPLYNELQKVVRFFSKQLGFDKFENKTGRKLAIPIADVISMSLFKHENLKDTKKSIYKTFNLKNICSYKTLVVSINRWAPLAMKILFMFIKMNRKNQHILKHIDSSDIPVCLFKNAHNHKTMKGLANYGYGSKGIYFGLKIHLISDLKRKILAVKITSANVNDRDMVIPMSKGLEGLFVADSGYISEELMKEFYQEGKRILLVKPRKNMKKIMTKFQEKIYGTRMLIELNFRNLKMFYGLVASLPRSISGYFANYIHALLAYQLA